MYIYRLIRLLAAFILVVMLALGMRNMTMEDSVERDTQVVDQFHVEQPGAALNIEQ